MNFLITYMFTDLEYEKKNMKAQVPQQNEMLSLYWNALGFINKNKEYNPE